MVEPPFVFHDPSFPYDIGIFYRLVLGKASTNIQTDCMYQIHVRFCFKHDSNFSRNWVDVLVLLIAKHRCMAWLIIRVKPWLVPISPYQFSARVAKGRNWVDNDASTAPESINFSNFKTLFTWVCVARVLSTFARGRSMLGQACPHR